MTELLYKIKLIELKKVSIFFFWGGGKSHAHGKLSGFVNRKGGNKKDKMVERTAENEKD